MGRWAGTHHAVQDVAFMRAVPGLQVIIPADANQAAAMTRALARSGEPAYVRMGRGRRGGCVSSGPAVCHRKG